MVSERMIPSGTAEIHIEEYGSGHPLVLLHGNGESARCFDGQLGAFAEKYRVIAVDSRGHGKSTHGGETLHIAQMSEDVIAVLDALGLDRAALLGFSDGANIALRTAFMHPERVSALIASGANISPHGIKFKYLAGMQLKRLVTVFKAMRDEKASKELELLELMTNEPNYPAQALQGITAPTLVTAGENDMIQTEHTKYIARHIKGARLHFFPGGHFTPTELPEEYNRVVLDFLHQPDLR